MSISSTTADTLTPSDIEKTAINAMQNAVTAFRKQLEKLHTGRASPALLETIHVAQPHGGSTRLAYISTITAIDARTLKITPFDATQLSAIAKSIQQAELSLNPDVRKAEILIVLPPMTDQRRKDTVKVIHTMTEEICEEIRNHRRNANHQCKALVKDKLISEDDEHRAYKKIQQLTDTHTTQAKAIAHEKEHQLVKG